MRAHAGNKQGAFRPEWLAPLRRMTRAARSLEDALAQVPDGSTGEAAAVQKCAHGGLAVWGASRDLVKLSGFPQPLLRDGRPELSPEELTEILTAFADDVETRLRLVQGWLAGSGGEDEGTKG